MKGSDIVFEDNYILVINKPAGITVNKADTTKDEVTVQDFVANHYKLKALKENDFYSRAGIVHRIDKETSGILIVAKDEKSFENLQAQFKNREVHKSYVALVHGDVYPPLGEISVPVGRLPWNRKRFGVLAGGKEASTNYEVIARYLLRRKNLNEQLTFLRLNPKTGRTHQIRVHLKYFNHPIFADFMYAGRKTARDDRKLLARVFLHAQKIIFTHPFTQKRVEFEAPLPLELTDFLSTLENRA